MSLHSRIFVPGVTRVPPLASSSHSMSGGVGRGFVPPTQARPTSSGAAASTAAGNTMMMPSLVCQTPTSLPFSSPATCTGAAEAFGAGACTPTRGDEWSNGTAAIGSSQSTFSGVVKPSFSLPQPPPLPGRAISGSVSATPVVPMPTSGCSSHITFCPCCGRRGHFVHEGESDVSSPLPQGGAACTAEGPTAPAAGDRSCSSPQEVDLTKRPPTAFKLYCDAVEPSLVARKVPAKERKGALAAGFEALGAAERAAYEARAEQAAKELKALKKRAALSGSKTGRGGEGESPPRRTKSSFLLFSDEKRPIIIEEIKKKAAVAAEGSSDDGDASSLPPVKINIAEVAKRIGELWKALTDEERKVYSEMAEALKTGGSAPNSAGSVGGTSTACALLEETEDASSSTSCPLEAEGAVDGYLADEKSDVADDHDTAVETNESESDAAALVSDDLETKEE